LLVNTLKVRNASAPDASDSLREGNVDYTREPDDELMQLIRFALLGGVLNVISLEGK
jgi:hypothetical protein